MTQIPQIPAATPADVNAQLLALLQQQRQVAAPAQMAAPLVANPYQPQQQAIIGRADFPIVFRLPDGSDFEVSITLRENVATLEELGSILMGLAQAGYLRAPLPPNMQPPMQAPSPAQPAGLAPAGAAPPPQAIYCEGCRQPFYPDKPNHRRCPACFARNNNGGGYRNGGGYGGGGRRW